VVHAQAIIVLLRLMLTFSVSLATTKSSEKMKTADSKCSIISVVRYCEWV